MSLLLECLSGYHVCAIGGRKTSDSYYWSYWWLWATTYVLGSEPGSSVRAAGALNHWAIFLIPGSYFFNPIGYSVREWRSFPLRIIIERCFLILSILLIVFLVGCFSWITGGNSTNTIRCFVCEQLYLSKSTQWLVVIFHLIRNLYWHLELLQFLRVTS